MVVVVVGGAVVVGGTVLVAGWAVVGSGEVVVVATAKGLLPEHDDASAVRHTRATPGNLERRRGLSSM